MMNACIPYHHPDNEQYSLAYVTKERDEIQNPDGGIIEQYECDYPFFVLYTDHGTSGDVDDLNDGFDDVLDQMPRDDRIITVRLLQIFEAIVDEKEVEEEEKLSIYKQIELAQIPDALSRVEWGLTAVDVAGQLMSCLILKHALPNANHRASISLAEWYLESTESGFSFPTLATDDYEWQTWVDEYIGESKRLLTVRRNTTAFSLLQEWGCTSVLRKGDIEIVLSDYDLDYSRSEAFDHYAEEHKEHCVEFMSESVQRAGYEHLRRVEGPTKAEFVEYLEQAE